MFSSDLRRLYEDQMQRFIKFIPFSFQPRIREKWSNTTETNVNIYQSAHSHSPTFSIYFLSSHTSSLLLSPKPSSASNVKQHLVQQLTLILPIVWDFSISVGQFYCFHYVELLKFRQQIFSLLLGVNLCPQLVLRWLQFLPDPPSIVSCIEPRWDVFQKGPKLFHICEVGWRMCKLLWARKSIL